jgi:hypothetical protein
MPGSPHFHLQPLCAHAATLPGLPAGAASEWGACRKIELAILGREKAQKTQKELFLRLLCLLAAIFVLRLARVIFQRALRSSISKAPSARLEGTKW